MQLELRYSKIMYNYYPAKIVTQNNVEFNEPVICKGDNSYISSNIPCRSHGLFHMILVPNHVKIDTYMEISSSKLILVNEKLPRLKSQIKKGRIGLKPITPFYVIRRSQ